MPGSLCNGTATDAPLVRESRAYCEGREAAYGGAADTTNPHSADTRDNALWASGHASYAAGVGSPLQRDCCAIPAYDGVP